MKKRSYKHQSVNDVDVEWLRDRAVSSGDAGTTVGLDVAKHEIVVFLTMFNVNGDVGEGINDCLLTVPIQGCSDAILFDMVDDLDVVHWAEALKLTESGDANTTVPSYCQRSPGCGGAKGRSNARSSTFKKMP